ncbi:MAG: phosphate uptake regulator PhoU [Candidatus Aenigmarchaeota archaeon]|nr:phosphate uptake regulator PhoU [Candidatus Aenigmarchaeota archaeon]
MMRKIIKLGDSYAMSLPKGWAQRFSLEKSKEIEIEENSDGTLNITAGKNTAQESEETIYIEKEESMEKIYAKIYRAYIQGFRKIALTGHFDTNQFEVISEAQKNLTGLEVIEQSGKRIVFKDFIHLEDVDIEKFTSSIFNHLISMATEITEDVSKDIETGDKVRDMDCAVDRTTNLIFRCLNLALRDSSYMKKIGKSTHELMITSRIIKNLEKIGNMLVGISYYMNEKQTPRMKEYGYVLFKRDRKINSYTIEFLKNWIEYIKPIRDALFNRKTDVAISIYTGRRSRKTMNIIFKMQDELKEKRAKVNIEYIGKLESHFEPTISLSYDIAKDIIVL